MFFLEPVLRQVSWKESKRGYELRLHVSPIDLNALGMSTRVRVDEIDLVFDSLVDVVKTWPVLYISVCCPLVRPNRRPRRHVTGNNGPQSCLVPSQDVKHPQRLRRFHTNPKTHSPTTLFP